MDLKVNDQVIQTEFDFAFLELKANRYDRAESMFEAIARTHNHYAAWCGMGLAKMGKLLDGRSNVNEIEYCFIKAKEYGTPQTEEIELLYAKSVYGLIQGLLNSFIESAQKIKLLNQNMVLSIGTAFTGLLVSEMSESFSGKLMGLGIGAAGTINVSHLMHQYGDIKAYNQYLLNSAAALHRSVKSFTTVSNPLIEQSETQYLQAEKNIQTTLIVSNQKGGIYEKWYHNNGWLALSFLFWPLGVYGLYMRFIKR